MGVGRSGAVLGALGSQRGIRERAYRSSPLLMLHIWTRGMQIRTSGVERLGRCWVAPDYNDIGGIIAGSIRLLCLCDIMLRRRRPHVVDEELACAQSHRTRITSLPPSSGP